VCVFAWLFVLDRSTDEHGQKIANTAEKLGVTPIELCNKYANAFQALNQRLLISNDDFIRTTMSYHHDTAQRLWQKCADAGDIYLSTYEGWYNEREETFVTEAEAQANDYKDPSTGLPLKRTSEESYFFRMSKYLEPLLAHYEAHPDFLQPETYRNNILARLRKEGLNDLSISRTSFNWGIPVPQGFDQKHVMYVWFDALTNYISGVRGLDPDHELSRYWPASCHIIGKDIIWFHCVIWPCMLLSAGVPLPERVFGHGFVNAADGRKMSKSFGNVVDPHDVLDMVPIDSVRYYICREATYGADLNFSLDSLKLMHNAELADTLGNLVNRATNLSRKYCNEIVPEANYPADLPKPFDLAEAISKVEEAMRNNAIHTASFEAMETMRAANKWLADLAPWNLKGDEHAERRIQITRMALEAIYAAAHLLAPIIPLSAQQIFDRLHTPPRILKQLSPNFDNLAPGTHTTVGDILFVKFETAEAKPAAEEAKAAKQSKKGGNKNKGAKTEEAKVLEDPNQPDFTKVDLRVGRITRVRMFALISAFCGLRSC
jgi:methionyl-tRNA synthetase